jgi:dihydropteroate synthase
VPKTAYLLPIAFAVSPQAEEGEAVRVAGGLAWASRFAVVERDGPRVVSHRRFSVPALQAALPALPDDVAVQFDALQSPRAPLTLSTRDGTPRVIRLDQPQIAGILNMTPDSFSDGGRFLDDPDVAHAHAMAMLEAGAALIDIGGESTRPGAPGVWEGDELQRVVPAVERLSKAGAAISIDTRRVAVMEAALAAGAQIINDVSALRHDPRALEFAARSRAPVILMHAPGDGQNLHAEPGYGNVVLDVFDWLRARRDAALAAGIAPERIILDPGIGFGKSVADNLALINALPLFHSLGHALMLGASRKRTIGALSNEAPAHKRLGGSLMLAVAGMQAGVQLLRLHDVAETLQALHVWRGLRDSALTDFSMLQA